MNRRAATRPWPWRHWLPQALECDNWSTLFGVLLNKSLYCIFPDPFLPRVVVTVSKVSGYTYSRTDVTSDKLLIKQVKLAIGSVILLRSVPIHLLLLYFILYHNLNYTMYKLPKALKQKVCSSNKLFKGKKRKRKKKEDTNSNNTNKKLQTGIGIWWLI